MADVTDRATGKPRRLSEMCSTCIMRPANAGRIPLRPGRLRELIDDTCRAESYVVCHSTLHNEPAVCRGFSDRYNTNLLRIIERLGGFVDVAPPPSGVA